MTNEIDFSSILFLTFRTCANQAIREAGIDLNGFLTVGVSAALRQLLEFGLFHGDPHPGNIFAMRDGRIAYVDFGNVAVLSQVTCLYCHVYFIIFIGECTYTMVQQ